MDQINNQQNNNGQQSPATPTSPAVTGSIAQDYLVTQKVDPSSISQDQMSNDLAALKSGELTTDTEIKLNTKVSAPVVNYEDLPLRKVREIDVLKLKNPFRGI